MNKTRVLTAWSLIAVSSTCGLGESAAAAADQFPTRPIRLIVPFAAGGGFDVMRVVLQSIASTTGEQIVMDNRGGAGGVIAAELAGKAAPDGYTIFLGGPPATVRYRICIKSSLTIQSRIFLR